MIRHRAAVAVAAVTLLAFAPVVGCGSDDSLELEERTPTTFDDGGTPETGTPGGGIRDGAVPDTGVQDTLRGASGPLDDGG